jgi:hypothetical protein
MLIIDIHFKSRDYNSSWYTDINEYTMDIAGKSAESATLNCNNRAYGTQNSADNIVPSKLFNCAVTSHN